MDSDTFSDDHLPVTKVNPMANTAVTALRNHKVGVGDKGESLNLVDGQQSNIAGCTEFLMSTKQLGSHFGCIPLTPMLLYQGTHRVWQEVPKVLQARRMIRDSVVPNFWDYAFLLALISKSPVGGHIFVTILTNNCVT